MLRVLAAGTLLLLVSSWGTVGATVSRVNLFLTGSKLDPIAARSAANIAVRDTNTLLHLLQVCASILARKPPVHRTGQCACDSNATIFGTSSVGKNTLYAVVVLYLLYFTYMEYNYDFFQAIS